MYNTIDATKSDLFNEPKYFDKLKETNPDGDTICCNNYYIEKNNKPIFINSAEFHYFRTPHQCWEQEILKIKMSGIHAISSYVAWILHEEQEGIFDFQGDYDIRKFVMLCKKHNMQFCLRIGPYIHAEVRNGGLPEWLVNKPLKIRSNDSEYLFYAKRYIENVAKQLEGLCYRDGGPIVAIYIENELEYESEHLVTLKQYINEAGLYAPIYFFTGMINEFDWYQEAFPTGGAYPYPTWGDDITAMSTTWNYLFTNAWNISHSVSQTYNIYDKCPYAITEMGSGIMTSKALRPVVPPNAIPAMVAVKLGSGCNYINYYMYHGGINPIPRNSYFYGDEISPEMSYDFQAPIGEFGQMREMNGHIKVISLFLEAFGSDLSPLKVLLPANNDSITEGNLCQLRYSARSDGKKGYLFINNYQDHAVMTDKKDVKFKILLKNEELCFPKATLLDIPSEEYAILPFNMEISGIVIKYATAQPLTVIDEAGTTFVIMVTPYGNATAEYGFDLNTLESISLDESTGKMYDDSTVIVENCGDNSILLTSKQGKRLIIKTISKAESINAWKINIGKDERLVITDFQILNDGDNLKVSAQKSGDYSFKVYPQTKASLSFGQEVVLANIKEEYSEFNINVKQPEIAGIQYEILSDNKAIVKIDKGAIDSFDEVFVVVDYEGNVAKAHLNDTMILDNYYHGEKWEIGIKNYLPAITKNDLIISIESDISSKIQKKSCIKEISYFGISTFEIR